MVYEPLHHKYRPQCFQDLVGQTAIATTLTNAIQQQRIAPAYLFTGPRGTGKTSSARILAKSLNCLSTDGPTATPCGQCDACVRIANGSALDVIEIDAASNTGVDNIRELIERSQFAPVQCRYKVYVVDECHMLSTAAFNALLKTLEEPPDRVVFVLATTDPQRVLATIISRCQRFDFRRIPLEAMVQHLQYIASQEQIEIDDPAIRLVAQIAQGGLRDAESLLDQLSLLEPPLTAEAVWDLVGAVPERDLFALVQAIAADRPEQVLDQARHLMNRGREPLIVLQNLTSFYRDLLIAKTAPQRQDLVAMTATTWQQLCEFAGNLDLAVILQGQQHLKTSAVQIKNTTQPRLWLEVTLLGLLPATVRSQLQNINQAGTTSASNAQVSIQSASSNPTARSQPPLQPQQPPPLPAVPAHSPALNTAPPPADPTQSQSPESAVPPPTSPAEPQQLPASESSINLTEIWQRALARIASKATQTLLRQQGRLIDIKGNHASISLVKRWRDHSVSRVEIIEAALAAVLDLPTVKVQWVDPETAPTDSSTAANSAQAAPTEVPPTQSLSTQSLSTQSPSIPPPLQPLSSTPVESPPIPRATPQASQAAPALDPDPEAGRSQSPTSERLTAQPHQPNPAATPPPPAPKPASAQPLASNQASPLDAKTASPSDSAQPLDPAQPVSFMAAWDQDQTSRAARSLAQFFNGEVVSDLDTDFEMSEFATAEPESPAELDSTPPSNAKSNGTQSPSNNSSDRPSNSFSSQNSSQNTTPSGAELAVGQPDSPIDEDTLDDDVPF